MVLEKIYKQRFMKRSELIGYCTYYKGEEDNPYTESPYKTYWENQRECVEWLLMLDVPKHTENEITRKLKRIDNYKTENYILILFKHFKVSNDMIKRMPYIGFEFNPFEY